MKFMYNCKDAVAAMLASQDRALSWPERVLLRLHLCICTPCPRFKRQLEFMQRALHHWRSHPHDT